MSIIGIFEDDHGLIPADPGRMMFMNNIPPAPPLPAIPMGVFAPPTEQKFLSVVTPVYTQQLQYDKISIVATFTFNGYTMGVTYAFSCEGRSTVVSVPNLFDKSPISWKDKDGSIKNTPEMPALMKIPLPLLTGNHASNPHVAGDDIVVKLTDGKEYICRGAVVAEKNMIAEAEQLMVDMLSSQAQCFYLNQDAVGFNRTQE